MMWVKICGITRAQDAVAAAKLGARAVGFIFHGLSPRAISAGDAAKIVRELPKELKKVGVFVNEKSLETIEEIAKRVPLDIVQLHGDERPGFCARLTKKVIKAFRPRTYSEVEAMAEWKSVHAWLVDAPPSDKAPGQYGGTGQPAEWTLAKMAKKFGVPVILAGGLSASNVVSAVKFVEPAGIDVSSGVETEPGVKDVYRMRLLFDALRRYEEEVRAKGGKPAGSDMSMSDRMRLEPPRPPGGGGPASERLKPVIEIGGGGGAGGGGPPKPDPRGAPKSGELLDRAPPWKGTSGEINLEGASDAPLSDEAPK
jgi:phosphoribosylanthranilate isomerase